MKRSCTWATNWPTWFFFFLTKVSNKASFYPGPWDNVMYREPLNEGCMMWPKPIQIFFGYVPLQDVYLDILISLYPHLNVKFNIVKLWYSHFIHLTSNKPLYIGYLWYIPQSYCNSNSAQVSCKNHSFLPLCFDMPPFSGTMKSCGCGHYGFSFGVTKRVDQEQEAKNNFIMFTLQRDSPTLHLVSVTTL